MILTRPPFTAVLVYPTIPSTPFITSVSTAGTRNNTGFPLGCRFTVGAAAITVTDLGRWRLTGNSQTHTMQIVDTSALSSHVAQASLNMSSGTVGAFKYASVTPVVLTAGHSYYIISDEFSGGDNFVDDGGVTSIVNTAAATINESAYEPGGLNSGTWQANTGGVHTFIPVNFQYHL